MFAGPPAILSGPAHTWKLPTSSSSSIATPLSCWLAPAPADETVEEAAEPA